MVALLKTIGSCDTPFTRNVPKKVFAVKGEHTIAFPHGGFLRFSIFNFFFKMLPLVQVRPFSRSKPSGHSQSKEPLVFTHLELRGQGSFSHSSASVHAIIFDSIDAESQSFVFNLTTQVVCIWFRFGWKLTLSAGGAHPGLLTRASEPTPFVACARPSVHTRVGHARVSWCSWRRQFLFG